MTSKAQDVEQKAKALGEKAKAFFVNAEHYILEHKKYSIPIICAAAVLIVVFCCCCCYCCCRSSKKKKKIKEKLKLKGAKPGKFLNRIQPGRRVKKIMADVGSMTFCLKYEPLTQILSVKVIESNDIPVRDLSGHGYSYVEVKLLPFHEDCTTPFTTTLIRPASFNPTYGDTFTFCVPANEIKKQVLYLYQYEKNRFSQQDGIGQLVYELKSSLSTEETEYTQKIFPYNPLLGLEKEMGAVFLSMEYDRENWTLTVDIQEADIIPEDEDKEKCTSYVSLVLLNKEEKPMEKRKSAIQKGTLQPGFDDEVSFSIPDTLLPDVSLLVKLKSKRFIRPTKLIGRCVIKPTSESWRKLIQDGVVKGAWFQVYKKPN